MASLPQEAAAIEVEAKGYRYLVRGNTLLSRADIGKILNRAASPFEATRLLKEAYAGRGYALVDVTPTISGRYAAFQVTERVVGEVDVPDGYRENFAPLVGRRDFRESSFGKIMAMAQLWASKAAKRLEYEFQETGDPKALRLAVKEVPLEGVHRVEAGVSASNSGDRYAGRYIINSDATIRPGWGTEVRGNFARALEGVDTQKGSRYWQAGAQANKVTRWGTFSGEFGYTSYRASQESSMNLPARFDPLLPGCSLPAGKGCMLYSPMGFDLPLNGTIRRYDAHGEHILYADATTTWTSLEGFERNEQVVQSRFPMIAWSIDPTSWNITTERQGEEHFDATDEKYNDLYLGTTVQRLFTSFKQQAAWTLGGKLKKGISKNDGTLGHLASYGGEATSQFLLGQVDASVMQQLPRQFSTALSLSSQWTGDTLPQTQQWVLGGFENLSAWMPGAAVGDSGFIVRADLLGPPWKGFKDYLSLQPSLFYETGGTRWQNSPYRDNWSILADAGATLRLNLNNWSDIYVSYAFPVFDSHFPEADQNDDKAGAYFYWGLKYGL